MGGTISGQVLSYIRKSHKQAVESKLLVVLLQILYFSSFPPQVVSGPDFSPATET